MKKILAMILVVVITLSLCACGSHADMEGNEVDVKNGDIALELTDEFTISKLNKSDYYVSGHGHRTEYTAVLKNNEYAFVVVIDIEQYACWENGDVVTAEIISEYVSGYTYPLTHANIGEDRFNVSWYGKY